MSYVFGNISRDEAEAKVTEAGLETDGTFLVRTREGKPGEYVMCVVFKNKPTHHLVTSNADGLLVVNKKTFNDAKKITDLVQALRKKQPGWPVALVKPVKNPEKAKTSGKKGSVKKAKAGSVKKPKKEKPKSLKKKKPIWLHGNLTKDEADALLTEAGLDDGRYLVRSREGKKTEFVLGVVYKGKPTHHLITKVDGNYQINKKSYGDFAKVSLLIGQLQKPGTPKWPVPLDKPVPSARSIKEAAEAEESGAAEEAAPAAAEPAAEPAEEPPAVPAKKGKGAVKEANAAETAAPAEPEVIVATVNQDITRVITRATINIGAKMNRYEPSLATIGNQLTLLEKFILDVKSATPGRMSFQQLNTAMSDGTTA